MDYADRVAASRSWLMAVLVAASTSCGIWSPIEAVVRPDAGVTYQEMVGWEATAQVGQETPSFPIHPPYDKYGRELLDLAVNDLGIDRVRLALRSGSENSLDNWTLYRSGQIDYKTWRCRRYATVNDNADPRTINPSGFQFSELDLTVESALLPLRERLEANGERLFVNLNYVSFTGQICGGLPYHHDDSPEEYAELIEAAFLHLQEKYTLVPDAVEIILEPDNTPFWRGRPIGEALVATGARLAAHGWKPKFIAPSNTNMTRAVEYFDEMMGVPGVRDLLGELSYHRYHGVSAASLAAIGARATQYGIQTAMLEKIGATHEDLHADLKVGRNSAWSRYIIGDTNTETGGLYYQVVVSDPARPAVRRVPESGFLRQYFRYVRRGARRIDATSSHRGVDPLAFVNADGSQVVVLKSARASVSRIERLPAGTYGVSYTTDGTTSIDAPDVEVRDGQPIRVSIPGRGVLTVYAKRATKPAAPPKTD